MVNTTTHSKSLDALTNADNALLFAVKDVIDASFKAMFLDAVNDTPKYAEVRNIFFEYVIQHMMVVSHLEHSSSEKIEEMCDFARVALSKVNSNTDYRKMFADMYYKAMDAEEKERKLRYANDIQSVRYKMRKLYRDKYKSKKRK